MGGEQGGRGKNIDRRELPGQRKREKNMKRKVEG